MVGTQGLQNSQRISVVTPTLHRPKEVAGLLENLSQQTLLPHEVILVDGAPDCEIATEEVVKKETPLLPFRCLYIRHGGGTAIQRNAGIDVAVGDYIAFIDDDIRLEPDFFRVIIDAFKQDVDACIGGITGYITNSFLNPETSTRWRWYRRLRLFTTYEPGRYDFETGSPINRYLQPPHEILREIDFMGAGCVVWRKQVFDNGLRFSTFFTGYGVLEDAHFALRAGRKWKLYEYGRARCVHLKSQVARIDQRLRTKIAAINHRYVFVDIVPERSWRQEFRFWRLQLFDLFRLAIHALRHGGKNNWTAVLGKAEGIITATRLKALREQKTPSEIPDRIYTDWKSWPIDEDTRRQIDTHCKEDRKDEIVIGHIDNDGRVLSLYGDLPFLTNISEAEFVKRYRFPLDIVLLDGKVLIRKDFRGDRPRFMREWHNLTRLQGKANVPVVYRVDEERCMLYKNLIPGQTVRDILVEAGAKILNIQTDHDPELAKLDTQSRLWAVLAEGTAFLRKCFPESFFIELKRQMDKIHACGVARLSLTFGNIIADEHGAPWLIDLEGAEAYPFTLHPLFLYRRYQDRKKFRRIYNWP